MSHSSSTRPTFRDSTQFKRGTDAFYRDILNLKIARNALFGALLSIVNEIFSNFHWYFRPRRRRRFVHRPIKNRISPYSSTNCFAHSKEYLYLFLSKSTSNRSKAICPLFRVCVYVCVCVRVCVGFNEKEWSKRTGKIDLCFVHVNRFIYCYISRCIKMNS